jgi:hypothetical protein
MSTWEQDSANHNHGENWELESPDGSIRVTRDDLCKAHWYYEQIPWGEEPYRSALKHFPGQAQSGAMSGCVGVALGWPRERTIETYEKNGYFRDLVESQLLARRVQSAMEAGLS